MKTIYLTLICLFFLSINSVNAQLKVKQFNGKVIIGPERTGDDYDNILTGSVFGDPAFNYGGSKLSFGDFGSYEYNGWNVFIGEYINDIIPSPCIDCDQLWLHGKNGTYLTYGNGDDQYIIGFFDVNNPYNRNTNGFEFNYDVYAPTFHSTSDIRLKTNIKKINNSLTQLQKLNGVSYNFKPKYSTYADSSKKHHGNDTTSKKLNNKEKKDIAFFSSLENQMKQYKPLRMGFVAQDLQKVFPELVSTDPSGYLAIDYNGLIPVIVESIKEQQKIIEAQSNKIKEMDSLLTNCCNKNTIPYKNVQPQMQDGLNNPLGVTNNAILYQNTPNPFSVKTDIRYFLPDNTQSSAIYIFDLQGVLLKTYIINKNGKGTITVNGNELKAGMYLYTLIADNKEVDTKRMILTQN